jgi:WD40 repeat protein/serine/threonine protein kinase
MNIVSKKPRNGIDLSGEILGKWRLLEFFGEGAAGHVYLAEALDQKGWYRALKIFFKNKPGVSLTVIEEQKHRFKIEATLCKDQINAHVIVVNEHPIETDNYLYHVMQYADGGSLLDKINTHFELLKTASEDAYIPIEEVRQIGIQIADGLDAIHRHDRGLVHRDICPSNILIHQGNILIADLGVAQTRDDLTERSKLGDEAPPHPGHIAYMSPQQENLRGPVRYEDDIFSVGCVLFELLTLKPYRGPQSLSPFPKLYRSDTPVWMDRIITKCLQEDRDGRFQEAKELHQSLEARHIVLTKSKVKEQEWLDVYELSDLLGNIPKLTIADGVDIELPSDLLFEVGKVNVWPQILDAFFEPEGRGGFLDWLQEDVIETLIQNRNRPLRDRMEELLIQVREAHGLVEGKDEPLLRSKIFIQFLSKIPNFEKPKPEVELNFGEIGLGEMREQQLVVKNLGGAVLEGYIQSPHPFSILEISENTGFLCGPGQTREVSSVIFSPDQTFLSDKPPILAVTLVTNTDEYQIPVRYKFIPPRVEINPEGGLDIGGLGNDEKATAILIVKNTGRGRLECKIETSHPNFIVVGRQEFHCEADEAAEIDVSLRLCEASLRAPFTELSLCLHTNMGDVDIPVRYEFIPPRAEVIPKTGVDFGEIGVGEQHSTSFTVKNTGRGKLECKIESNYSGLIIEGAREFTCESGQATEITVALKTGDDFLSATSPELSLHLHTNMDDISIPVRYEYVPPRAEVIAKAGVDFGELGIGEQLAASFKVKNVGRGYLDCKVETSHSDLEMGGANEFICESGQIAEVNLTFKPSDSFLSKTPPELFVRLHTNVGEFKLPVHFEILPPKVGLNTNHLEFNVENLEDPQELVIKNTGRSSLSGIVKVMVPWLRFQMRDQKFRCEPEDQLKLVVNVVSNKLPLNESRVDDAFILETNVGDFLIAVCAPAGITFLRNKFQQGWEPSPISAPNVAQVAPLNLFGRGRVKAIAFFSDGATLAVATSIGISHYDLTTFEEKRLKLTDGWEFSGAFSLDGSLYASGLYGEVKLWDVANGREVKTLRLRDESLVFHKRGYIVRSIAFSPDGALLASVYDFGLVKLWDVKSGRTIKTLPRQVNINSVVFSPDGALLASGLVDGRVKLWDVVNGYEECTLSGHTRAVRTATFSPDGTLLATGSDDGIVRLWDLSSRKTGVMINYNPTPKWFPPISSVNFSSDGALLAWASLAWVTLWEVASRRKVRMLGEEKVNSMAFSPDGVMLGTKSELLRNSYVKLWDVASGREVQTLFSSSNKVKSIAFSSNGALLASGSDDGSVKLLDVKRGRVVKTHNSYSGKVSCVTFSPNGALLASGSENGAVKLLDVVSGLKVKTLNGSSSKVNCIDFSPSGELLASGSDDGAVKLWDVASGREVKTLKGHFGKVNCVVFSLGGALLVSGSDNRAVKLWNVKRGREVRRGWKRFIANVRAAYSGYQVLSWDSKKVESMALSPDGEILATGSSDGLVNLWNLATGNEVRRLPKHSGVVKSVAFSPDGSLLVSGSYDGTMKLCVVVSGQEEIVRTIKHSGEVNSVAFSPDGALLASGSDDGTVRLWVVGG